MKSTARVLTAVSVLALAAGCGQAPQDSAQRAENADFRACMVTDSGGIDDRSFNATAWAGIQAAEEALGISSGFLESEDDSDYVRNVNQQVQADCGIVVTVGFLLAKATGDAALANPEENFAIVDYGYDLPEEKKYANAENLKGLVFNTAEAAYLAGYVAAGMSKTGTVATYGGLQIPTVTIFMDGFWEGVQRYNDDNGADVQVLGWDEESQRGSFTGDFEDQNKGKVLTENFIQQGADIVMPVAGPVGLGTLAAAKGTGDVSVIWVDTDGCDSLGEQDCQYLLTSVMKGMDVAVEDAVTAAVNGEFTSEKYVGTLENGGVGIAPYHEFEDEVPQELKDQVEAIKQEIIGGEVEITSPAQPE